MVYVCPYEFINQRNPNFPNYSIWEIDYYVWIPPHFHKEIADHRLSLRKNLGTEEYEVFREFRDRRIEVLLKTKNLDEALGRIVVERDRFHAEWGGKHERDMVCTHKEPRKSLGCPVGQ